MEYVRDFLHDLAKRDAEIGLLCERAAFVICGRTEPEERATLACEFSPRFMLPDDPGARDAYDVLVTTDILAEGQNLQQCGRLVNFDLPWNPMRIVQRNGRIDRIGSSHSAVTIHCFMPDQQLDAILGLEKRLQRKIAYANASIGVEISILPAMEGVERNFVDNENAIHHLAQGDASDIDELERKDAFSGEEFREEESLPWGIGSGYQHANQVAIVFLAKAGNRYLFRTAIIQRDAPETVADDLLSSLQTARCAFGTKRYCPKKCAALRTMLGDTCAMKSFKWFQAQRDPRARQAAVSKAQRDAVFLLSRANDTDTASAGEVFSTRWPGRCAEAASCNSSRSECGSR